MHGNAKFLTFFVTGIGLKTEEDGYEVKFILS